MKTNGIFHLLFISQIVKCSKITPIGQKQDVISGQNTTPMDKNTTPLDKNTMSMDRKMMQRGIKMKPVDKIRKLLA